MFKLCRAVSAYSICHTPGSPVPCCVSSFVSTRLRQCSTRRFAYPRTEQTSVSPECWCAAHFFRQTSTITFHRYYVNFTGCGRRSESTTRLPFSCIGVCTDLLGVPVCMVIYGASRTCRRDNDYGHKLMVSKHVSRPDVEPVHSRQPRAFPIAAARVWNTLLPEVRSFSSLSTFKRRLKTEIFSRIFPD